MALVLKSRCQGTLSPKRLARRANSEITRANNSLYQNRWLTATRQDLAKLILYSKKENIYPIDFSANLDESAARLHQFNVVQLDMQSGMWLDHLVGVTEDCSRDH